MFENVFFPSGMNDLSVTPKGSVFATPSRPPLHAHNSNSSNGSAGPVTPKSSKKVGFLLFDCSSHILCLFFLDYTKNFFKTYRQRFCDIL